MDGPLDVSVVIPTLGRVNRALELSQHLNKLDPQPSEILFVFQRADELREWEKEQTNRIARGLLCPSIGAGAARNFGGYAARSHHLVFLDDDCFPADSGWLAVLTATLDEKDRPLCTGAVLGWDTASGSKLWMKHAFRLAPPFLMPWGNPASESSSWCDTVAGGNFAVTRSSFMRAGGFAEIFGSPSLYEETEFSLRLTSNRRRAVWFAHGAAVTHRQDNKGGMRLDNLGPSEDFLIEQKRLLLNSVYGEGPSSRIRLCLYRIFRRFLFVARRFALLFQSPRHPRG